MRGPDSDPLSPEIATALMAVDATLARGLLVPSFMRLAGTANWWSPPWMRRIYDRFGFSDAEPEPVVIDVTSVEEPRVPAEVGARS